MQSRPSPANVPTRLVTEHQASNPTSKSRIPAQSVGSSILVLEKVGVRQPHSTPPSRRFRTSWLRVEFVLAGVKAPTDYAHFRNTTDSVVDRVFANPSRGYPERSVQMDSVLAIGGSYPEAPSTFQSFGKSHVQASSDLSYWKEDLSATPKRVAANSSAHTRVVDEHGSQ